MYNGCIQQTSTNGPNGTGTGLRGKKKKKNPDFKYCLFNTQVTMSHILKDIVSLHFCNISPPLVTYLNTSFT